MCRDRNALGLVVALGLALASPAIGGTATLGTPVPAVGGEAVPVGTVRTLPVVTVCVSVGSTGKDVKRAVYTPPPGWFVRSHKVEGLKKHGLASYTISTVPAHWQWSNDEELTEAAKVNAAGSATAHVAAVGGGQLAAASDRTQAGRQHSASSHHALVVEAVAAGGGFLRSGAGIELTVVAEMVYLGPPQ